MFIIFRVVATIICLLSIHILFNTKYKGREVAYLLLITVVFFIHNIYIFPIYFKDFPTLKIIDDAAPFTVFYGPLLLGYYYVLNEGKIETIKIIIHISPIIFLFTTYYIFITNTDVREAFSAFYFHFVYFVLGLSMILYPLWVLFKARRKPHIAVRVSLFARYCILSGVFLFSIAFNGQYHRVKSPQGQNLDALLVALMLICGAIILLIESFSCFKRGLHIATGKNIGTTSIPARNTTLSAHKTQDQFAGYLALENLFQSTVVFDRDLTVNKVAQLVKSSPEQVSIQINTYYKSSLQRVLTTKRILLCMRQLSDVSSEVDFETLPYAAGFRSKATFYRNFSLLAGCSPREYRRRSIDPNFKNNLQ